MKAVGNYINWGCLLYLLIYQKVSVVKLGVHDNVLISVTVSSISACTKQFRYNYLLLLKDQNVIILYDYRA